MCQLTIYPKIKSHFWYYLQIVIVSASSFIPLRFQPRIPVSPLVVLLTKNFTIAVFMSDFFPRFQQTRHCLVK